MTRILIAVEGETEETFVNEVLSPHLCNYGFQNVAARLVGNSRARHRRGGIGSWPETKKDLVRHLKQDQKLFVGLMVDYYALPANWPKRTESSAYGHDEKARSIQRAIHAEVSAEMGSGFVEDRFVPLIMMHEFEAILFSDTVKFARLVDLPIAAQLKNIVDQFGDPEKINDSPQTAPSKRILSLVPNYQKPLYGNLIAMEIGLVEIRNKCSHFNSWVTELETRI
jgi:Domain of unknown function (DUF4276)